MASNHYKRETLKNEFHIVNFRNYIYTEIRIFHFSSRRDCTIDCFMYHTNLIRCENKTYHKKVGKRIINLSSYKLALENDNS